MLYNIVVVFVIYWHELAMGAHVFPSWPSLPLPFHPIPQGLPSAPALSTLSHASHLGWQCVSHMVTYLFQCCSLKSSCPWVRQSTNLAISWECHGLLQILIDKKDKKCLLTNLLIFIFPLLSFLWFLFTCVLVFYLHQTFKMSWIL